MPTKNIYVAKVSGSDAFDGLTPATAKQTLGAAKAILQAGENSIYIAAGDYVATVDFSTAGNYVELFGDPTGAIFTGITGEVIWNQAANHNTSYCRSINNLVMKQTAASKLFFTGTFNATHNLIANSVVFRCYAASGSILFGVNYSCWAKVTLNNCSHDTGEIRPGSMTIGSKAIINNYDGITAGMVFNFNDGELRTYTEFNNCQLRWRNAIACSNGVNNMKFIGGTLKRNSSSAFDSFIYAFTGAYVQEGINLMLFKDITLLKETGATLDVLNNTIITGSIGLAIIQDINFHNSAYHGTRIIFDNVNSSGTKQIQFGHSLLLNGDGETYNSRDVLYFNGVSEALAPLFILPLLNLLPSTQYTIDFSYKKVVNSTASTQDITFFVLDTTDSVGNRNTVNKGKVVYTASTHTTDTWYDKTITFTTSSVADQPVFLVLNFNGSSKLQYNFKITKPVITAS